MSGLQNFDSDDCEKLVPQGAVLQKQNYVRVILLGMTLDDDLATWEKDDKSIYQSPSKVAVVGLPHWYLATSAVADTKPKEIDINTELKALVSADMVLFPNYGKPPKTGPRPVIVTEKELISGKLENEHVRSLSDDMKKSLLRSGRLLVPGTSGEPLTIELEQSDVRRGARAAFRNDRAQPPSQVLFSASGNFPMQVHHTLMLQMAEVFEGDYVLAIQSYLADSRAGIWHDPKYDELDFIKDMPDDIFDGFLSLLKQHAEWDKVTRDAAKPQLPSFPIALVSVFEQTFELKGYTRGRLVESATIGPDETVTTEIFTFERLFQERTDEFGSEAESTLERKRNNSTTAEIMSDVQNTVGAGVGGELGLGIPIKMVDVNAGVSGEVSTEIATQNQNTAKFLSEASVSATERFKATHQVKTITRRESGTEQRTTRVFKNPNLGRTLNLYHFEVIGEYRVRTDINENQRMALLVENPPIGPFDRDWIRAHHHFLDEVLLHDAYREGLQAAQVLAAQEWVDELAAAEKRAQEEERQRQAEPQGPSNTGGQGAPNYLPNKGIFATARRLEKKLKILLALGGLDGAFNTIKKHLSLFGPGVSFSELEAAEKRIARTAWWTQFNLAYQGMHDKADAFVKTCDRAFQNSDEPSSADDVVAAIGELVESLDDDWLVSLKTFGAGYLLGYLVGPWALDPFVHTYVTKLLWNPDDLGLPRTLSEARADYALHRGKQSVETLAPPAPPAEDLQAVNMIPPPPRAYSLKELSEAHAAFDRLVLHLQAHAEYYSNAFIKQEDPSLRMTRLTNIGVAPFVENQLWGFAGNSSIFPLRIEALPKEVRDALKQYSPESMAFTPEETTVTIPTGGLVSEVVLGACDALEPYLSKRRRQDLRERGLRNQLLKAEVALRKKELDMTSEDDDTGS